MFRKKKKGTSTLDCWCVTNLMCTFFTPSTHVLCGFICDPWPSDGYWEPVLLSCIIFVLIDLFYDLLCFFCARCTSIIVPLLFFGTTGDWLIGVVYLHYVALMFTWKPHFILYFLLVQASCNLGACTLGKPLHTNSLTFNTMIMIVSLPLLLARRLSMTRGPAGPRSKRPMGRGNGTRATPASPVALTTAWGAPGPRCCAKLWVWQNSWWRDTFVHWSCVFVWCFFLHLR